MQLILGLALAAAVFVILKKWGTLSPEGQKAAAWKVILVAGGALLLFMVLTGRIHVITAGIAALTPLLRKLPELAALRSGVPQDHGWGSGWSFRAAGGCRGQFLIFQGRHEQAGSLRNSGG